MAVNTTPVVVNPMVVEETPDGTTREAPVAAAVRAAGNSTRTIFQQSPDLRVKVNE